ncbi:MAG: DNA polymerase III subunit delta' [Pseudomonadales bacterium]
MNESAIYPWQQKIWDRLAALAEQDRLPHAILFSGQARVGKRDFAMAYSGYLLCREASDSHTACGECPGCKLVQAGNHPDRYLLGLEEDSSQIKVDQARDLIHWASQTASLNGRKAAVIEPADAMNVSTANALLKCLEEPAGDTVLLLVTAEPNALLPTIRSRCQVVNFPLPPKAEALAYLAEARGGEGLEQLLDIADGAPLRALEFDESYLTARQEAGKGLCAVLQTARSPLDLAETLAKKSPADNMEMLYHLLADALAYGHSGEDKYIKNKDLQQEIMTIWQVAGGERLAAMLSRVLAARRLMAGTSNAAPAMLFEWLLLDDPRLLSLPPNFPSLPP